MKLILLFWGGRLKILSLYFYNVIILSLWKWAGTFIWINLNSFTHKAWSKLGRWLWRRFLNCVNVFSAFLFLFHLTNLNPFTEGYFISSLFEIGPMVLKMKAKIRKIYDATRTADNGHISIRIAHLSLLLRLPVFWRKTHNTDSLFLGHLSH